MVKDFRDVVGKHHRVGTNNKLMRKAMLLDEKKKLQHQFKETFKASGDKIEEGNEQGNEEEMITISKLGKVFCETLTFCVECELWRSNDNAQDHLTLHDDSSCIHPEMIYSPIIGVSWIDTSIDLCFKGNHNNDESKRDKIDFKPLRMIQPTQENQQCDDEKEVECAMSTTFLFV